MPQKWFWPTEGPQGPHSLTPKEHFLFLHSLVRVSHASFRLSHFLMLKKGSNGAFHILLHSLPQKSISIVLGTPGWWRHEWHHVSVLSWSFLGTTGLPSSVDNTQCPSSWWNLNLHFLSQMCFLLSSSFSCHFCQTIWVQWKGFCFSFLLGGTAVCHVPRVLLPATSTEKGPEPIAMVWQEVMNQNNQRGTHAMSMFPVWLWGKALWTTTPSGEGFSLWEIVLSHTNVNQTLAPSHHPPFSHLGSTTQSICMHWHLVPQAGPVTFAFTLLALCWQLHSWKWQGTSKNAVTRATRPQEECPTECKEIRFPEQMDPEKGLVFQLLKKGKKQSKSSRTRSQKWTSFRKIPAKKPSSIQMTNPNDQRMMTCTFVKTMKKTVCK